MKIFYIVTKTQFILYHVKKEIHNKKKVFCLFFRLFKLSLKLNAASKLVCLRFDLYLFRFDKKGV